jgi:hypothetical protein
MRPSAVNMAVEEAGMSTMCGTRTVKIAKHLHAVAPSGITAASIDAFAYGRAGSGSAVEPSTPADDTLRAWLENNPIPAGAPVVAAPLFHGTLVFVRMTFQEPGGASSAMSLSDVQVAVQYATLAVNPIQRYASLYGPNSVNVSPNVIEFDAQLAGNSFTMSDFEGWVDQCASMAKAAGIGSPCIVILHNRDLPNSPSFVNNRNAFHSMTSSGNPYCYCLVFGEGLSVADNNHTSGGHPNDKVYAHILSHEIAEMVVDPQANLENREVCDACAGNCDNTWFCLFDQSGTFLGGTADTATSTGYAYFINSIVSASAAVNSDQCIVDDSSKQSACVYAPPEPDWTDVIISDFAGQNWLITPAGFAVGEQPGTFDEQRWILVLSGVLLVGVKGQSAHDWFRETLRFMPDVDGPLNYAINRYGIPVPTSSIPGVNFVPRIQVEQWAPFVTLSSIYDANVSVDAGFAVDLWRPAPFGTITNAGATIGNIFTGVRVDVAVRDSDAYLYRLGYNITLEGRIVFESIYLG